MLLTHNTNGNYNPRQLKLPLELEKIIDISDPVYSFSEIVDSIDFTSHFVVEESKTGRPRYNPTIMLKIILFSFMENGYLSLRNIEKSCTANHDKVFVKVTELIDKINAEELSFQGIKFETRTDYAIEYLDDILKKYAEIYSLSPQTFVSGKGHRKSIQQRNDQLLPAYNMQAGICDEYIAVIDVKQYAIDTECFVPLMNKFNELYGHYPKYPIADAGYGSFNNYLFCEEHGMEKFMKFTIFEKRNKRPEVQRKPLSFRKLQKG